MCLITERTSPLVAEEDIVVYKIVREAGGYYYSPFIDGPLREEPWDTEPEFHKVRMNDNPKSNNYKKFFIHGGGIHAFLEKEPAEYVVNNNKIGGTCGEHYIVIEGKIPAGTEYYDSPDGVYVCSRKIVFDEKYLKILTARGELLPKKRE